MSAESFATEVLLRSEQSRGRVAVIENSLPGVPHTLANLRGAPARYVLICVPGGFERYFDRLAAEYGGVELPPEAAKPYPETIVVAPRINERPGSGS